MLNRLESLSDLNASNSKKPASKFKPKFVQRRAENERKINLDLSNQQVKKEQKQFTKPKRDFKSRQKKQSTLISSGPLASGITSRDDNQKFRKNTVYNVYQNSENSQAENTKFDSFNLFDGEIDDQANKKGRIEISQFKGVYDDIKMFPLHAHDTDNYLKLNNTEEYFNDLNDLKQIIESEVKVEEKINKTVYVKKEESEVIDIVKKEFGELENNDFFNSKENLYLFQLPKSVSKVNSNLKEEMLESDEVENNQSQEEECELLGQIGNFCVHKLGQITIELNDDAKLTLKNSLPFSFLQQIVVMNINNEDETKVEQNDVKKENSENEEQSVEKETFHAFCRVHKKITAIPSLD